MRYATALGSHSVRSHHLTFFGHLHCADTRQVHHRAVLALQACVLGPSVNWRWRIGRPRQSWLRTVEAALRPMNLGLATVKRHAKDRLAWRKLVAMAPLSHASEERMIHIALRHCYDLESFFFTSFLLLFFS